MMTARIRRLMQGTVILLSLLGCQPASAGDEILIIVASDAALQSATPTAVREIYLKKILMDDSGHPFVPVNLPPDNPLRLSLAETLFSKSAQQLQDYWNQRYFQGVAPPYVVDSQEAMVQFVAKTPGAIGYVAACHLDVRVKPILAIPATAHQRDALRKLCPPAKGDKPAD